MSPRTKSVNDSEILAATGRVIGRVGPAKLTLALVANEVGLAPATLIQRFGSKRGLLLALGRSGQRDNSEFLDRLRATHKSPTKILCEYLLCFADMAGTPEEMANHLAAYQMDLIDPELREVTLQIANEHESIVAKLLGEAIRANELSGFEPKKLAPILLTVVQGSLLSWALYRRGAARKWAKRHLDTTLEPYLIPAKKAKNKPIGV